jgi:hypothetical protein
MAAWLAYSKHPGRSVTYSGHRADRCTKRRSFLPQCPLSQCLLWMNHRS